ncbi:M10 family metallopeptidase C-terminal domain-containing protein [Falsiroseomonas sp.]|uniref:M10 family metallopeptidase C-terminal domain-containing protein n=1 Tax=Falsiroseomonas sp. TaxID=2870721 RepID=UPI003563CC93
MCWLCFASSPEQDSLATTRTLRAEGASPTAPRLHLTGTGHQGVDGLLSGFAWSHNDPVSFAFPDSASDYEGFYGASEPARGFGQAGPTMRDAVRKILLGEAAGVTGGPGSPGPGVLGFTNLALVESAQDGWADIRIARSSAPTTAWAYYPNGREGGDVWFGARYDFNNPLLGNYQFMVAVHELGHALGLKHPHEAWNGFQPMPLEWDSLEFTVMSYRSRSGASVNTGYTNGAFDYPQGWMMLDIAALQAMYGADYTLRAGDTRYAWDPATGETFIDGIGQGRPGGGAAGDTNRVFLTVWDGGGVDTYDLSSYAHGVLADLAPGGFSVLSAAQLATLDVRDGTKARGNVFNALLHQDNPAALIENATGGAGADTLRGNQASNRLEGAAGADWLEGRDGADLLLGGSGADTLLGGAGPDTFIILSPQDRVVEAPGQDIDTVIVETGNAISLAAGVEVLRLGTAGRVGIGNDEGNLLFGNDVANRLEGRGGADVIEGRGGADTMSGGAGADMFVMRRGDGFDRLEDFAPGQDRLLLTGFGLTAEALLTRATMGSAGLSLDLGAGDGLLLAGLQPWQLSATDFVLAG